MSLLIDALKKAEQAKREAEQQAAPQEAAKSESGGDATQLDEGLAFDLDLSGASEQQPKSEQVDDILDMELGDIDLSTFAPLEDDTLAEQENAELEKPEPQEAKEKHIEPENTEPHKDKEKQEENKQSEDSQTDTTPSAKEGAPAPINATTKPELRENSAPPVRPDPVPLQDTTKTQSAPSVPESLKTEPLIQPQPNPNPPQWIGNTKPRRTHTRRSPWLWRISALLLPSLLVAGFYYYQINTTPLSAIPDAAVPPAATDQAITENETAPVVVEHDHSTNQPVQQAEANGEAETTPPPATELSEAGPVSTAPPKPAAKIPSNTSQLATSKIDLRPAKTSSKRHIQNETPTIKVKINNSQDSAYQNLQSGYEAYQRGDYVQAEHAYLRVLKQIPNNRDALLGLAIVAQRQGHNSQAVRYFKKMRELNPKDSVAVTGLLALQNNETLDGNTVSRIKLMLDEEPTAAHLYATLGNHYSSVKRWPEAQQAFFDAFRYAPQNPDYAFNLAISLDRLGHAATALSYYRKALTLAAQGNHNFNRLDLQKRIRHLEVQEQ